MLGFLEAPAEQRDYSAISGFAPADAMGKCVYCKHCHPCPAGLDVALINKYYDLARLGDGLAREHYLTLEKQAGDCVGCGHCDGPDLTFRKPCVTIWLQLFMRRRSIMSEVKKGSGLVYKNHPLRRIDNLIYYGSMADKYIVLLQILDTKKEQDMDVATRVSVQLQMTDPDLKSRDRVVKKSEKDSLYAAMDVGCIWLERALAGK